MIHATIYSHEKIVIILPGVESEFIEEGLVEFYSKGDLTKLNLLFNVQVCWKERI